MVVSAEKRTVILCLLLMAVTLAFYNPIVQNGFTQFDDGAYILTNPQVQTGLTLQTVKWSFTTFHAGYWHPLTWMSHALDCQIFHLNPAGHHYVNLLLHAANALLLFLLLQRATGLTWPSLIVGALFALHPINVESVAWIAERKNVLSMLFFLLALLAYDRYARTGKKSLYWSVTILFALGLMAKPQIVTLPFVLLLWDYWPLQRMAGLPAEPADAFAPRSFGFLVLEKWPFFLLAAADSVITVIAQRAGAAVRTAQEVPLASRLGNAVVSYVRYAEKLVWPSRLAPMYPHPGNSIPIWHVAGATALLIGVSAAVMYWRDQRYLLVGWFWFLGTLVPMIGLVTVGEQAMADRFAYVPCIGLFIAMVWGLAGIASVHHFSRVALAGSAIILVVFGCLTYHQLGYWHDDEKLWRYTLSITNRNYMAHDNLALALAKQGNSDEAVIEFRAANSLHHYPPLQVLNLAVYEQRVGHPREAIEECQSVLKASTDQPVQSAAWSTIGQAQLQLRDFKDANASFQKALLANSKNGAAMLGLGLLALQQGQSDAAISQLSDAVRIDPVDVNFLLLASAFRQAGHLSDADSAALQAARISRDLSQAHLELSQILGLVGLSADSTSLVNVSRNDTRNQPAKNAAR